jgi:hypothetical protein
VARTPDHGGSVGRWIACTGTVETNTTDAAPDTATTRYQERIYPPLNCVGVHLWIRERLRAGEGGTTVVAHRVHHDGPPRRSA